MNLMSEQAWYEREAERTAPRQTMDQDHRDWHVVNGRDGCPWDVAACDPDEPARVPDHTPEPSLADDDDVPF